MPGPTPESYWNHPEDWAEFFTFKCPSCKQAYRIAFGSDVKLAPDPKPLLVQTSWDPRTSKVGFKGVIICGCLAKFDVNGTSDTPVGTPPPGV